MQGIYHLTRGMLNLKTFPNDVVAPFDNFIPECYT